MTSHKGYNEPGSVWLIGPSCTRLAFVVVLRFHVPSPEVPFLAFAASASLHLRSSFRPNASPSFSARSADRRLLRLLSIQTPGPGTVEIIKRRPAFGRTSGIRVGALYSRHYPPRKLGRDETASLSLSLSCFFFRYSPRSLSHSSFLSLSRRPPLHLHVNVLLFLFPWGSFFSPGAFLRFSPREPLSSHDPRRSLRK